MYQRKARTVTIYRLYDAETTQSYVGSTAGAITTRWAHHLRRLRAGLHNAVFQSWWCNYGITHLRFQVLEEHVPVDKQFEKEQEWFQQYCCNFNGTDKIFNMIENKRQVEETLALLNSGNTIRATAKKVGMSIGWVQKTGKKYELVDTDEINYPPNDKSC